MGQVILVRHAETAASAAGLWQGTSNGAFSARGRTQLVRLARRIRQADPDLVVSSDLGRAEATAGALGHDFDVDTRWRQPDVGAWDGLTSDEIHTRFPELLEAFLAGDDVAFGGADRFSDLAQRARSAYDDVAAKVAGGGTAVVVTHGLTLLALMVDILGLDRVDPIQVMDPASVTVVNVAETGPQMLTYNDVAHLDDASSGRAEGTDVVLIRHGRTAANVEQRWQGHGDWPLDDLGVRQARRLGYVLPRLDALYASPLVRARATAEAVGDLLGREVRFDDALKEIGFGSWENLTTAEIAAADPEGWRVFASGADVVRGGNGETFESVRLRTTAAIERIVRDHTGQTVGVVSHGGATRAYLSGVLGISWTQRAAIHNMVNTGFSRFAYRAPDAAPVLVRWNVAPHLEDLE